MRGRSLSLDRRGSRAAALAVALLTSAATARAQTVPSFDARTWRPSTDPDASLVLEPPSTPGAWQWNLGAWASYSHDPVTLRDAAGNAAARPVRNLVGADLVADLGLGKRAAVGIDVPVLVWQDGDSPLPSTVASGGSVPASSLGDLALTGKVSVVPNERQGVHAGAGLGALATVTLPTGDRAGFGGEGAVTSSLRAIAEYAFGVGAIRASLGYTLRTERRTWPAGATGGVTLGDAIPWSVGAVLRPKVLAPWLDSGDRQVWEVAAHGSLPAGPIAPFGLGDPGATLLSPALLAVDDRVALGHAREAYVLAGIDFGLDGAIGVPALRAVLSVGWAPRPHDRDFDGVPDEIDECPDLPEDRDGIQDEDGCPEDDADSDGILDEKDACPLVPGVPSSDPKKNGCPGPPPPAAGGK